MIAAPVEDEGITGGNLSISNIMDQANSGNMSRELMIAGIKESVFNTVPDSVADKDVDNVSDIEQDRIKRIEAYHKSQRAHDGDNDSNNDSNYNYNNESSNRNFEHQLDPPLQSQMNISSISQQQKRENLFQKKKFGEHSNADQYSGIEAHGSTEWDMNGENDESLQLSQDRDQYFNGKRGLTYRTSSPTDLRNNRNHQFENHIRQDMFRECTFKPQIKVLPRTLYPEASRPEGNFYERVTKWQDNIKSQATNRAANKQRNELDGCTWRPKLNPESIKYANQSRISESDNAAASLTVGERLYSHAEKASIIHKELIDKHTREKSLKDAELCTFKPDLTALRGAFAEVSSKHMHIKPKPYCKPENATVELTEREKKECTFTPKIKQISNKMKSAKVYLKQNVVNRLARPMTPDPSQRLSSGSVKSSRSINDDDSMSLFSDKPAVDSSAFLTNKSNRTNNSNGNIGGLKPRAARDRTSVSPVRSIRSASAGHALRQSYSYRTPVGSRAGSPDSVRSRGRSKSSGGLRGGLRSHSAPRERSSSFGGSESFHSVYSKAEMEEKFELFIQRQRNSLVLWDKNLKSREIQFTPKFKPEIKSSFIDNSESSAVFLQRMEADLLKRAGRKDLNSEKLLKASLENSFTPEISNFAKTNNIQTKYNFGISRESFEKRQEKKQEEIERYLSEELADVTFHPKISKLAKSKESQLGKEIRDGSGKFLQRYKQKKNELSEALFQEKLRREEMELKECTFVPKHSILPGYIKRMADSLKVIRQFQKNDENKKNSNVIESWKF